LRERVSDLRRELNRSARVDRTGGGQRLERLAGDELERGVELALILADLVKGGDMGIRERGRLRGVALESCALLRIVSHCGRQQSQGDRASMPRVARAVQLAHAAGAEAAQDGVVRDTFEHGA